MKKLKTIIILNRLEELEKDINFINKNLDEFGNVFYIMRTKYKDDGNVELDCLDILNVFLENNYAYKNIILFPLGTSQKVAFLDNVGYIIWISKNNKNKYFDKDPIREEHIWKNVEWGRRTKNYNPKGKDPGNIWIPTEDDGKGNITKHIKLTLDEIIERLINMSGVNKNDEYTILGDSENLLCDNIFKKNILKELVEVTKQRNYKVFFGTSENMDIVDDYSVKHCITSPPYWDLKDYFKEGQIGQESYEEYLLRLKRVFGEVYKKLSEDGSFWININIRRKQGKVTLNPKDIVNICKQLGFNYKGIIIWHKSSGIPVGDFNLVDRFEFVFIFSKSKVYQLPNNIMSSFNDYRNEELNGKAFWNINRKAGSVGKGYKHPAIYPKELVRRSILCNSLENDVILDPFLGSGTSLIACLENNRSFIGFEYNEGFKDLINYRLKKEDVLDGEIIEYEILKV